MISLENRGTSIRRPNQRETLPLNISVADHSSSSALKIKLVLLQNLKPPAGTDEALVGSEVVVVVVSVGSNCVIVVVLVGSDDVTVITFVVSTTNPEVVCSGIEPLPHPNSSIRRLVGESTSITGTIRINFTTIGSGNRFFTTPKSSLLPETILKYKSKISKSLV